MINPFFMLLFFSIFIIIGGGTLGQVIRRTRSGGLSAGIFSPVIAGLMFGLMPLLMAWFAYSSLGAGYLFYVQVLILFAAILIAAFLPDEYLASLTAKPVVGAAFGGFFFLMGVFIVSMGIQERTMEALVGGGIFMLAGLGTAVGAIFAFLKDKNATS